MLDEKVLRVGRKSFSI